MIGDSTKTRRSRAIALSTACVAALRAWRVEQKRRQLAAQTWHSGDLVFDRGDGRLLPLTTWQKAHKRFCDLASVPVITPHALRHTNATLSLESGTHPLIVSKRLGHKSVQITLDRYSHVSADLERATMEAFDRGVFDEDEAGTG